MEGADEGVTAHDAAESEHLRRKYNNEPLKPDGFNMLESSTMFLPPGGDWPGASPQMSRDTVEGQSLKRFVNSVAGSEPATSCPSSVNHAGVTVEELTVKNYKDPNLAMVGSSNSREEVQRWDQEWEDFYQLAGGHRNESLPGGMATRNMDSPMPSDKVQLRSMYPSEAVSQKPTLNTHSNQDHTDISKQLTTSNRDTIPSNALSPAGVRSKVLSSSGFSQFFLKNTLKGKGVLSGYPAAQDGADVAVTGKNTVKTSDASLDASAKAEDPPVQTVAGIGEVSLREWLKSRSHKINKVESFCIFRQIVELVNLSHSQGIALPDLNPSCFVLLASHRVKYVGSLAQKLVCVINQDIPYLEHHLSRKRPFGQGMHAYNPIMHHNKYSKQMIFAGQQPQFPTISSLKYTTVKESGINDMAVQESENGLNDRYNSNLEYNTINKYGARVISSTTQQLMTSRHLHLEEKWYTSPEELNNRECTFSSNIYSLGVLLFELLSCFESWEVRAAAMSGLRHRILPPSFLSGNPTEAGFCLWLLHPEPSSRPTARRILQDALVRQSQELSYGGDLASSVEEDDAESELLLHFLISLKEQKENQVSKLAEDIGCLEADIKEVEKRNLSRTADALYQKFKESTSARGLGFRKDPLCLDAHYRLAPTSKNEEERLVKIKKQLENVYFSMRSQVQQDTDAITRSDIELLKNRDRWIPIQNENEEGGLNQSNDHLGAFFSGLCKYARYSKFEVCGTLRNRDILQPANVIFSLSFDRDEEYFATAGVSKKIKIFEFQALLDDSVDIHYPLIEMASKSKLTWVCWNSYIKNYLASTDYEGVVQLWDASTGQGFSQFTDHEKRAWSVDFSQLDPKKLASGSDDFSVKIWSINEKNCIGTIRNAANVCCVQFSAYSTHLLAFGSADYKTFCYDLRHTRIPWCTLTGHRKAVSYVKFLDPETLVSASTDSTLKLWDLKKTSSSGLSATACGLTFRGHTNEKNFVGLTVSDGYIACGSETNEVYAYHRSLSMPITSHKFGSFDPITGKETADDSGQFVSSVCWRGKSNTVVAASSSGSIKLLQMV